MSSIAQPHRGFGDIVDLVRSKHATTNAEAEHPQTPPLAIQPQLPRHEETTTEKAEHSMTVADIHTALKERGAAKDEPPKHHTKMPSEGQGHKVRGEEEQLFQRLAWPFHDLVPVIQPPIPRVVDVLYIQPLKTPGVP